MGAEGGVTVYRLDEVERRYAEMWPDNDIQDDWYYLKTITFDPGDDMPKYVFDYADDQGRIEGTGNEFWFARGERWTEDDLPEGLSRYDLDTGYGTNEGTYSAAQARVLAVLKTCEFHPYVEVWT